MPQLRLSKTVIGWLFYQDGQMSYDVIDKTNTYNVLLSLKRMIKKYRDKRGKNRMEDVEEELRNMVIIMDRHQSHKSPKIKAYLDAKGIEYLYLPPSSSQFNPCE